MTERNVKLVALTAIRRRKVVSTATKPGEKDKTVAEDISAGRTFDATEEEAAQLTRGERPAARRANLDEQASKRSKDEDLEEKTVEELKDLAEQRGVALTGARTKADIIAAIRRG